MIPKLQISSKKLIYSGNINFCKTLYLPKFSIFVKTWWEFYPNPKMSHICFDPNLGIQDVPVMLRADMFATHPNAKTYKLTDLNERVIISKNS